MSKASFKGEEGGRGGGNKGGIFKESSLILLLVLILIDIGAIQPATSQDQQELPFCGVERGEKSEPPCKLEDPSGFVWDIQADGSIKRGGQTTSQYAFEGDGAFKLSLVINNKELLFASEDFEDCVPDIPDYLPPRVIQRKGGTLGGTEVRSGPKQAGFSLNSEDIIEVERWMFVPEKVRLLERDQPLSEEEMGNSFIRYLEVLTNQSKKTTINEVSFKLETTLGSGEATRVVWPLIARDSQGKVISTGPSFEGPGKPKRYAFFKSYKYIILAGDSEGFEKSFQVLPWDSDSTKPEIGQWRPIHLNEDGVHQDEIHSGVFSARALPRREKTYRSEAIRRADTISTLEVPLEVQTGGLSFWFKVSSENTEWDKDPKPSTIILCEDCLNFYIKDENNRKIPLQGEDNLGTKDYQSPNEWRWGGRFGGNTRDIPEKWHWVRFKNIPAGKYTFHWEYAKDERDSDRDNADTAWLDDIAFPPIIRGFKPSGGSIEQLGNPIIVLVPRGSGVVRNPPDITLVGDKLTYTYRLKGIEPGETVILMYFASQQWKNPRMKEGIVIDEEGFFEDLAKRLIRQYPIDTLLLWEWGLWRHPPDRRSTNFRLPGDPIITIWTIHRAPTTGIGELELVAKNEIPEVLLKGEQPGKLEISILFIRMEPGVIEDIKVIDTIGDAEEVEEETVPFRTYNQEMISFSRRLKKGETHKLELQITFLSILRDWERTIRVIEKR